MKDTIIKGTGNSRTLKTVPNALTLYPDFLSMMQALINGTFPIDIGPLNAAGVDVQGTMLNKANLLKDATAALYGKDAAATPDEIFAFIRQKSAIIETGEYRGNAATSKTLSFSIKPEIVFLTDLAAGGARVSFVLIHGAGYGRFIDGNDSTNAGLTWSSNSVTITQLSGSNSRMIWNGTNRDYRYCAVGQ